MSLAIYSLGQVLPGAGKVDLVDGLSRELIATRELLTAIENQA